MHLVALIFTCIFLNAAFAKYLNIREDECIAQGVQCSRNCSALVYCLAEGGQEIVIEDCSARGENCATIDGLVTCSRNESDCPSSETSFQCVQSGPFPDPFDCSLSYACQINSPNPVMKCECPSGYYWDTTHSECSNDFEGYDECCTSSESKPKCDEIEYDGNFGSCHPGYYYICTFQPDGKYQVFVLRCDANMIYNPTLHRCEPFKSSNHLQKKKKKQGIHPKIDAQCSLITTTSTTEVTKTTKCIEMMRTTEGKLLGVRAVNNDESQPWKTENGVKLRRSWKKSYSRKYRSPCWWPTDPPTDPPTDAPTDPPTDPPTDAPTDPPTDAPTDPPTDAPTDPPTDAPTDPCWWPTDPSTTPPPETTPPWWWTTDPPTTPPETTPPWWWTTDPWETTETNYPTETTTICF